MKKKGKKTKKKSLTNLYFIKLNKNKPRLHHMDFHSINQIAHDNDDMLSCVFFFSFS